MLGTGGSKKTDGGGKKDDGSPVKRFGFFAIVAFLLWICLGSFFVVDTQEQAIVLRFGKFNRVAEPGLNFKIPQPIETIVKRNVTTERTERNFSTNGFIKSSYSQNRLYPTYMLTGDENIVDLKYLVSWNIDNLKDFYFNVTDAERYVASASESAMRDVINRRNLNEILTGNKGEIIGEVKILLQEILDSYGSGIEVLRIDIQEPQVPEEVKAAYDDVNAAKIEKVTAIEQANRYRNQIIREVNGQIAKIINEAEAYKESVISDSTGKASRFNAVFKEYAKAKTVTRDRIYLETMEKVLNGMDKIIMDNKSGVVPYLPLNELTKRK